MIVKDFIADYSSRTFLIEFDDAATMTITENQLRDAAKFVEQWNGRKGTKLQVSRMVFAIGVRGILFQAFARGWVPK